MVSRSVLVREAHRTPVMPALGGLEAQGHPRSQSRGLPSDTRSRLKNRFPVLDLKIYRCRICLGPWIPRDLNRPYSPTRQAPSRPCFRCPRSFRALEGARGPSARCGYGSVRRPPGRTSFQHLLGRDPARGHIVVCALTAPRLGNPRPQRRAGAEPGWGPAGLRRTGGGASDTRGG